MGARMNRERAPDTTAIGLHMLAVAGSIGLSSWFMIDLTRPAGGVTVIWLASGLLAGILLTSPHRVWPAYIAAAFVGDLLARTVYGDPLLAIAGRGFASTLEPCIVVYALRFLVGNVSDPANLRRVARVAMSSTLVACAISALIAAATSLALGSAPFVPTFAAWFISHTLGMVIFATLVGVARDLGTSVFARPGRHWKFARSIALVAATTLWVFSQSRYPSLFLIYPPLLLAVFRHRFAGWVIGMMLVVVISAVATETGTGPLSLMVDTSVQQRTLLLQLFIAITCLTTLPVAVVLAERGRLAAKLRESERNYRLLADNSRDLVVRMQADGQRLYVSPAVKEVLGWEPGELAEPRSELVHPDDRARLADALKALLSTGKATAVVYRMLHKDGHYVWIEALARRVQAAQPDRPAEIVYTGRDISKRVLAEQALADEQRRLGAVTDNLPALVTHIDTEQKYTFVNAFYRKVFGSDPGAIVGHSIREVRGEPLYATLRPHVEAVLRGELVTFEGDADANGRHYYYQTHYIPDIADGAVRGFYAMTFDISELKRAQQDLLRLAQHDSLTGLGNRNKFNERLTLALAKSRRNQHPIALIYLDIDRFKRINDTLGHAVGDAVLCEFARRLEHNVRDTDLAARLGGDEFAVIIEDIDSPAGSEIIARKLLAAMQREFVVGDAVLCATTSIGIAFCRNVPSADTLMQFADNALYEAKAAGRNTYRIATAD